MRLGRSTLLLAAALGVAAPATAAPQQGRGFDALLRRVDHDLDGRISAAEFPGRARGFRRLDRDGDGFITRGEFGGAGRPDAAPDAPAGAPRRAPTSEELEFFEMRIRPVLVKSCASCHGDGEKGPKGGLRVDSLQALLTGGAGGPAIVPGDPDASPLIEAVRYGDPLFAMPPKEKLADEVVHDLERWVALGAPWPEDATPTSTAAAPEEREPLDLEAARAFWSFQSPVAHPAPDAGDDWAWTDIDRFLRNAMAEAGVAPVADSDRATWLRRATFDLTGLPPTPEELDAFLGDRDEGAHERVVDRLLESTAYAERWGRHWLDVARYGESSGKENNIAYPHAWRYRDWVIDAFATDVPYDEFLRRQLAGDLLPAPDPTERAQNLIATGYLALGPKSHNARDPRQFQLDVADEQIDAVGQGLLGMTISCARCHDHKFDPVPIEDYYSFAGIFLSTDTRYGTLAGPGNQRPGELIELPADAEVPDGPTMSRALVQAFGRAREQLERRAERARREADDATQAVVARQTEQAARTLEALLARFDEAGRPLPANRLAMGALEGRPRDIAVLERGELDRPGDIAPRGFPQVLRTDDAAPIRAGSGRRELAEWIASDSNPLTARVWVNRVWSHLFGTGLVRTPDNFGAGGLAPDHPELLDRLAADFMAQGWSTRRLVRELVLTRAYRLASDGDPAHEALDPEALTRWRMPDRRLEAEAIRDAMLAASGELDRERPVGSPSGVLEGSLRRAELIALVTREEPVRSVYLTSLRGHIADSLDVFDAADPSFVTGDREETTVATQALFLMNDETVLRLADAFAGRLLAADMRDDARIDLAFRLALGRDASPAERRAVQAFLRDFERLAPEPAPVNPREARQRERRRRLAGAAGRLLDEPLPDLEPHRAAWSAFCQTLFQSAEFRTLG